MQCVCGSAGWRLGGGSRQPSRPNQVFKKRAVVRLPQSTFKITRCGNAEPLLRNTLKLKLWGGRGAVTPAP